MQWCEVDFCLLRDLFATSPQNSPNLGSKWRRSIISGSGFYLLHLLPWDIELMKEAMETGSLECFYTAVFLTFHHEDESPELLQVGG